MDRMCLLKGQVIIYSKYILNEIFAMERPLRRFQYNWFVWHNAEFKIQILH